MKTPTKFKGIKMPEYLGCNHWKLGPPPNWMDYVIERRFRKNGFRTQDYINDWEMYFLNYKEHSWGHVCDLDKTRQTLGELCLEIESLIGPHARDWDGGKQCTV